MCSSNFLNNFCKGEGGVTTKIMTIYFKSQILKNKNFSQHDNFIYSVTIKQNKCLKYFKLNMFIFSSSFGHFIIKIAFGHSDKFNESLIIFLFIYFLFYSII